VTWALIIKSLLEALVAYLQLKNKSFYYDITQKSKIKQKEYIDEIEKLRTSRDPNDADYADIMRGYLLAEKQYIKHLSAIYLKTIESDQNSNS
jgi:hypothetical protein